MIRAKLWDEPKEAQFFIDRIDSANLSRKQLKLLHAPAFMIKLLFRSKKILEKLGIRLGCLLYTSPSPRDQRGSRMPSSA